MSNSIGSDNHQQKRGVFEIPNVQKIKPGPILDILVVKFQQLRINIFLKKIWLMLNNQNKKLNTLWFLVIYFC